MNLKLKWHKLSISVSTVLSAPEASVVATTIATVASSETKSNDIESKDERGEIFNLDFQVFKFDYVTLRQIWIQKNAWINFELKFVKYFLRHQKNEPNCDQS